MYHVWCHLPPVGDYWTTLRSIKRIGKKKLFFPFSITITDLYQIEDPYFLWIPPTRNTNPAGTNLCIQEHVKQVVNVNLSWLYRVRLYSFLIVTLARVLVFRSPLRSSLSCVSPRKDLRGDVRHLLEIQNGSFACLVMRHSLWGCKHKRRTATTHSIIQRDLGEV
jgi:hypothetical protein